MDIFPYATTGHTLDFIPDDRQPQFSNVGVMYGGLLNDELYSSIFGLFLYQNEQLSLQQKLFEGYERVDHSSVVLPADSQRIGYILIWGGITPAGNHSSELFQIDLPLLSDEPNSIENVDISAITQSGDIPPGRSGHTAVYYNGNMVIFGGRDESNIYSTIYTFDVECLFYFSSKI